MRTFETPRVVVSQCLGFARCRYNGAVIEDRFVDRLRGHVTFCPVCPEMEIGLGCPREPIRVVSAGGERRLVQPATGRDLSADMRAFAARFLDAAGEVDGFLLKSRSPSCGIKDVKEYRRPEDDAPRGVGCGFFGEAVLERFGLRSQYGPAAPSQYGGCAAVEDEGRLNNFTLREHFLTRLFTLAAFREVSRGGRMKDLVRFQAENKGLLMAYHQAQMRKLGRIVANHEARPDAEVLADYGANLAQALARPPRFTSIINVLMHALGYVSGGLAAGEKALFLDTLEKYRAGQAPLGVATALVKAWSIRFNVAYLLDQTFLEPYPEALLEITDSGKGRGS